VTLLGLPCPAWPP